MKQTKLRSIVMTAFFAAIIFVGIQAFRIPLPAAVGTPFLHFGHIFVVLAVLMLGPKRSAIAGVTGLVIFDILNGYIHSIPNVFVTTLVKCLVTGMVFLALKKKGENNSRKEYIFAILCAAIYGVCSIVLDFVWSSSELILAGSSVQAALTAEVTAIPATIINAIFTVAGTAILYLPVERGYQLWK
ncbi:putative membrane protein [Catenibacillus scindens]|uniref:Putative membrane protein n=1 Tax=Catenibacillus scindens TaxID=673271 RepID=A0A7W8H9E4_9FIRM|nr:ECF transporter S component [Catenibacillus scindens]MBB5263898.1 putative membrane protein [Catenibacillus scindens]